jgi:hypothetical protein
MTGTFKQSSSGDQILYQKEERGETQERHDYQV